MSKTVTSTFTASEVAELAEMNPETLRVWRRRGHFTLQGEGKGWTRFTFSDVLKIATFRTMIDNFFNHDAAEVVAANCPEQYAKIFGGDENTPPPYLIFARAPDGEMIFEIIDGFEEMSVRLLTSLGPDGGKSPTLHVIDYTSILSRVMTRFEAMNDTASESDD